jgi:hypothetical protein
MLGYCSSHNIRVVQSENIFSMFNIRLHLRGGLGGWRLPAEPLGRMYFVVSLDLLMTDCLHSKCLAQPPASSRTPTPAARTHRYPAACFLPITVNKKRAYNHKWAQN